MERTALSCPSLQTFKPPEITKKFTTTLGSETRAARVYSWHNYMGREEVENDSRQIKYLYGGTLELHGLTL
jgi:hypothetical protein